MAKTLSILSREKAGALLVDTAMRVTFKALAVKPQLIAFSDWLYSQGYCVGFAAPEALPYLQQVFDEARNPIIGSVEFFRPEYAAQFIIAKAVERGLPVESMREHLNVLVTRIYNSSGMFGFATDKIRERAIDALEQHSVELTIKETVNAAVENVGQSGVVAGKPDAAPESAASPASSAAGGGN